MYIRINQLETQYRKDTDFLQKPVILEGTIQSITPNLIDQKNSSIVLQTYSLFNTDVGSLKESKKVVVIAPFSRAKFLKIGQKITIYKINLTQPKENDSYKTYFLKEGLWATAFIYNERIFVHKKRYLTWYQSYFEYLSSCFNTMISQLYNPLFLGKKEKNNNAIMMQHQSLYWGIIHHMARSGVHLVSLLGLFEFLFHYCRIFHRFRFLVYAIFAFLYALISVPSISFIRSLLMIMFQMFAKFNGFIYSGLHAFLLTTLIVIHYNPVSIVFLDFQLSFGITAIIIWLFFVKRQKTIAFL